MKTMKAVSALVLAAMMVVPALAADEKKEKKAKGKGSRANAGAQLIKQLEAVGLTEDQKAKINELGKALAASRKKLVEEAGLTAEVMKKRQAAMKELKDSGKKGKDLAAAINEKAGISKEQVEALAKANALRATLKKDVLALLSDDQKAKLPKAFARGGGKAGAKKGAGGAKKPADGAKKPAKKKDAA